MLASLLQYRGFIWRQAVTDLRHRYAGTGIGIAWNVIHPLALIGTYAIVFSLIYRQPLAGITIYICSGIIPWLALADCVTRGSNSFLANANYLKRLAIPEVVFVAQSAAATSLSLAINFLLLLIVAIPMGALPRWTWLLLPLPLLSLVALGFSAGFLLGTLNVFFRDINEWVAIALQVLFWTVPIVYRTDIYPTWLIGFIPWHPFAAPIVAVHQLFLDGTLPAKSLWISMIAWPAGVLAISAVTFGKLRDEMRDLV